MNIQKDWKAKLESAYSFMLKYSKMTVYVGDWGRGDYDMPISMLLQVHYSKFHTYKTFM